MLKPMQVGDEITAEDPRGWQTKLTVAGQHGELFCAVNDRQELYIVLEDGRLCVLTPVGQVIGCQIAN